MKTVQNIENITIKLSKEDLLEGRYVTFTTLSNKLRDLELEQKLGYKQLRNRLYNSRACGKYNTKIIAGMVCFDTTKPMKTAEASLVLKFEIGD